MRRKKKRTFFFRYIIVIILLFLTLILINLVNINNIKNGYNKLLGNINFNNDKIVYDKTLKEENKELKKEIEELKKITSIEESSNYERLNAKVIKRNYSYYYSTITINKGKKDGIKGNEAVVDINGLIGKVSKVYYNTCTIKLITNKSNISAKFSYNDNEYYGIITKYDIKNNLLYLEKVIGTFSNDVIGASVVTSGLNDNLASGLIIGEITSYKEDKYNLSNTMTIKLSSNLDDLNIVSVIKEK